MVLLIMHISVALAVAVAASEAEMAPFKSTTPSPLPKIFRIKNPLAGINYYRF
jgi:hypothetical protein